MKDLTRFLALAPEDVPETFREQFSNPYAHPPSCPAELKNLETDDMTPAELGTFRAYDRERQAARLANVRNAVALRCRWAVYFAGVMAEELAAANPPAVPPHSDAEDVIADLGNRRDPFANPPTNAAPAPLDDLDTAYVRAGPVLASAMRKIVGQAAKIGMLSEAEAEAVAAALQDINNNLPF